MTSNVFILYYLKIKRTTGLDTMHSKITKINFDFAQVCDLVQLKMHNSLIKDIYI